MEGSLGCGVSEFDKLETFRIGPDEVVHGDRYYAGNGAAIDGTLEGDFFALSGQNVNIAGTVTGDVNTLSSHLRISGTVGDDVRTCSGHVTVSGKITGDLMALSPSVRVMKGATIGGRTLLAGAQMDLYGDFLQDVIAGGGKVVFGGNAARNVKIEADAVEFEEGAHIKGNLTYTARQEIDSLRAGSAEARKIVEGGITFVPKAPKKEATHGPLYYFFWWVAPFIGGLLCGFVLIALARGPVDTLLETARNDALKSLGFGILGHIFAPFAGLILVVLCVTLPIGLLVIAMWGMLFYLAKLVVAASLGDVVLRRLLGRAPSPYIALLAGWIPIWILFAIPALGLLSYYLLVPIFGIGVLLVGLRAHSRGASTSPIPATQQPMQAAV